MGHWQHDEWGKKIDIFGRDSHSATLVHVLAMSGLLPSDGLFRRKKSRRHRRHHGSLWSVRAVRAVVRAAVRAPRNPVRAVGTVTKGFIQTPLTPFLQHVKDS